MPSILTKPRVPHESSRHGRGGVCILALVACCAVLAGCERAPAQQGQAQPEPALPAARAAQAGNAAQVAAGAWPPPDKGCTALSPGFSSQQGSFRLLECLPKVDPDTVSGFDAMSPPVELRFQHRGPDGETSETYAVDADAYSAIVDDRLRPQFWGGHLVTLDLRYERGGLWLIGNWTGSSFVVTPYAYASGDEDGLDVKWDRDAFVVTTVPEGERRVTAHDSGGDAEPGYFMTESTTCTMATDAAVTHKLRLGLGTDGRVIELEYASAVPVGDGTHAACLIQAGSGDYASDWTRAGNGDTTVDIASEDDGVPGSQLRIRRNEAGDTYTVDFDVVAQAFCGNSDAIARQVVLRRDAPACVAVRMPGPDEEE